jgi:acetate kinase
MGVSPLEGLVMGTRSGDVDPALHAHLHRELERLRQAGDERARLAFDVYCYRIKKYVGAYYAVLGHVDAVVFTAGVGQHSPAVRAASLAGLGRLGIEVDPARNTGPVDGPTVVSPDGAEVAVLVVPTNEEWEIARQTLAVVDG